MRSLFVQALPRMTR